MKTNPTKIEWYYVAWVTLEIYCNGPVGVVQQPVIFAHLVNNGMCPKP